VDIKDYGDIRLGEYEPGNGTNYKAVACRWNYAGYMNALGRVSDGWLVINCNNQKAYLFQKEDYFADDYIQEKLGGFPRDYPFFGDLVRELIGRK